MSEAKVLPSGDVELRGLLEQLSDAVGLDVSPGRLTRSVAESGSGDWMSRLALSATAIGLEVRWVRGQLSDIAPRLRPDLPVVTIDEAGTWWLLDGRIGPRFHAWEGTGRAGGRWLRRPDLINRLGGDEVRTWAMLQPTWPAAPLATPPGRNTPHTPWRRVYGLLRAERSDIAVIAMYAVATGVLSLATPLAIQVLINWLAFGALLQPIVFLGAMLLLVLTLAAALRIAQRVAVEALQRRLFVRIVADLAGRLPRVKLDNLDKVYGPELVNRFFDVLTLQKATTGLLLDGLGAALQAAVGLVLLALYHPVLLAFDVMVVLGMTVVLGVLGVGAERTALAESKAKYQVAGWLEELARHPLAFRLDGARVGEDHADGLIRSWLETRSDHFTVFMRQYGGAQLFQVFVSTALLVTCGWLVLQGQLTIGQLVAAEFIMTSALTGFAKFTDKLETFYDLVAAIDKLGALVDLEPEDAGGIPPHEQPAAAALELRKLGFAWPDGRTQFEGVDLKVKPGERVGILAVPGVGKSLLAELVLGLRQPTTGRAMLDGVGATEWRPEARYKGVAMLRSDGLFHGTIAENILLGRVGLDRSDAWQALEKVGLGDTVSRFRDGLDTQLGPEGRPLSESQARAVLVARAMVGKPRLIVVDGALDGLSPLWRDPLLGPLAHDDAPWTLLVFTDDATVASFCDRVFTLTSEGLHVRPRLAPV